MKAGKQHLPLSAVIALIVVVALAAGAAGWFVLVSPKRAESKRLEAEIASTQAQVVAYHAASLQAKGRTPIRVADLFRLSKAMPDRADMSGVLLQLNQIAADTGITFQSIAPQTSVPISGYQAMPIQLTFEGNFYNLADFLFRLRNLVAVQHGQLSATGRLFAIDTLAFSQSPNGGFPQIAATLVVDAFVYGIQTPASATPTTTTATTPTTPGVTTTTPAGAAAAVGAPSG